MLLKPIPNKTRVYMQIVEQIKEQIKAGQLKQGSILPSERELAERMKVSRSSVREAITILESLGIIEVRQGKGSYVRDFRSQKPVDNYFDTFAFLFDIDPAQTLKLLQIRKILEPQAAALAAENATEQNLLDLRQALEEMKKASLREEVGEESDFQFHYLIAASTGNEILLKTLAAISDLMLKGLQQTSWMSLADRKREARTIKEHELIIEAIERNNALDAQDFMLKHLEEVESNFKKLLKEEH